MAYGVKFCGGCNPRFDRGKALKAIQEALHDRVEFELAEEGKDYEGLLVIGGCPNCCPAYKHFRVRRPPVKISDENHIDQAIDIIKKEAD